MRISVFALIVTGLLLSSMGCSKYEENSFISLRSKAGRLDNEWSLVMVKQNNIEVTQHYGDDYGYKFDRNGSYRHIENETSIVGTWEFNDDKTEIRLTEPDSPTPRVFKILKLTNRALWWQLQGVPDEYIQHFEQKK